MIILILMMTCYCLKTVRIGSFYGLHFCRIRTEYGDYSAIFCFQPNARKCEPENSKYGQFSRSVYHSEIMFTDANTNENYKIKNYKITKLQICASCDLLKVEIGN